VANPGARIYIHLLWGQARQLRHASQTWDAYLQASELYAAAAYEKAPDARKKMLGKAKDTIDALLPYYDFLDEFCAWCTEAVGAYSAGTLFGSAKTDVIKMRPPYVKLREEFAGLAKRLGDLANGATALPAPESLGLLPAPGESPTGGK
jgi:hypothetical protein